MYNCVVRIAILGDDKFMYISQNPEAPTKIARNLLSINTHDVSV